MPDESNKYSTLATNLVSAMKSVFIQASQKVTSWSQTPSNDNIPSEKLVKDSLNSLSNNVYTKTESDTTFATIASLADVATSGSYTDLDNTPSIPTNVSDLTNDSGFLISSDISGKEDTSNKVSTWSSTPSNTHYPSELLVKNSLDAKANVTSVPTKVSDLTNDLGFLTTHQTLSEIGGTVTVEKQQTAESGYSSTYVIKQNGTQVGSKINIPKDFLVQSAGMSEVTTANNPVNGYAVGDKYLWFRINTEDDSGTNEYIYILVSDLIDVYDADNSTLEVNNNTFKVKNGGIGTTQLSSSVNTSLGYADAWNSSVAKNITSTDINKWNSAGSSNLAITDVDGEVESYLNAIITELNNS